MQIARHRIKNILAVRNDRFGEFLLNIPAFRALKETFKNSKIIAVVDERVKELAKCIPYIDEIVVWDRAPHRLREKLNFIRFLKKQDISISILLNPSKELNFLTFLSFIPLRVGYNRKCSFLLTHKRQDRKALGEKHEIEYNLDLVSLVGAKTEDKNLKLILPDIETKLFKKFEIENTDNFIVIHPWTSDPVKQWPIVNFLNLAKKIISETNLLIVIVGGGENLEKSRELSMLGKNIINLTGKTTLVELAVLLKKAKLLISGDSGPVHLAACVETPVVALFRSDLPGKTAKRWGPWGENHAIIEKQSLFQITVQEVFQSLKNRIIF
ncbi:MAG: hypothetical protein DRP74_07540 [Candidatus Omnitrophota bacterium]|nr:MAG: hypothetical protein DRP74_07540 [Candidatus Omnitrophota bacterium]